MSVHRAGSYCASCLAAVPQHHEDCPRGFVEALVYMALSDGAARVYAAAKRLAHLEQQGHRKLHILGWHMEWLRAMEGFRAALEDRDERPLADVDREVAMRRARDVVKRGKERS